ncbi:hypothetical protein Ahy_A04g017602 [Arachis hypogaea]|uniref:GRF-type domain-containing protein n=1 Tax=Arachis hypogaea TaxID=3818 RepID=A0A445DBK8_ARAHY|nr:hypothetical protein Ahy_A04g017602 [Arachis hypogaea]
MSHSIGSTLVSSGRRRRATHAGADNPGMETCEIPKGQHPKCGCGLYAIVSKSRTPDNPGRLFFGCPKYKQEKQIHCNFFVWFESVFNFDYKKVGVEKITELHGISGDDGWVEERFLELENRIGALKKPHNSMSKIDWKSITFNVVVFVIGLWIISWLCLIKHSGKR